ncbi:MAG: DUF5691 domain-containing protein [Opitutaceae bacterium]
MSDSATSLSTIALLGTVRETPFPDASHPLLTQPWQAIDTVDRPRAVLQAAALEAIAVRAGVELTTGLALPPAAEPEKRHFIPEPAVIAAQRMLAGEFTQGFDEWLSATIDGNFAAPHRILPSLLDRGTHDRSLRALITQIAGERGIWLARRNQQWRWLLETVAVPDDAWEVGSPDERIAWLRQTRASDPQRAAKSIAADWKNESAVLRETITELVATSPSPVDADWLESLALNDRRQNTRNAAIRALSQIPNSKFLERAIQRIEQLLSYRRAGLSKVLSLTPPDAFAPEWKADGIREKSPQGTGEKAWWMGQLLAQVPLSQWATTVDLTPEKLLQAKLDPDWSSVIQQAWIETIQRFPEPECIQLLIPQLVQQHSSKKATAQFQNQLHHLLPQCLQSLNHNSIAELLEQTKLPIQLTVALLVRFRPPIDPNQHKQLFKLLTTCWNHKELYLTRPDAVALAYCPAPTTIQQLLERIAKLPDLNANAETFANALEFRQSYLPSLMK